MFIQEQLLINCNWLTLAEYGEGSTLSSHKDRYTERFSEFMLNGGIRRLQRHGLKADGNYGKIDNLHISYNGNRITTVLEDADPVTQSGSMDYPGAKREMRFGYNDWGALVSDESRGIEAIEYDSFGNPVHIKFSGRDYTKNVYSATGVKLATEHYTHPLQTGPIVMGDEPQPNTEAANAQIGPGIISPEHHLLAGQQKIEYRGPVIYRNFKIDMVLFPGGYATIGNDNAVTFHYYTQDYLGNNRAVVNGSTGAVEQTTAYYPYGAVIPDLGTGNSGQPFKFGGKELVNANGLNAFDFGARMHYPAIPHFDRIDPMAETYTWLSPYLYCGNNPVNAIDTDGKLIIFINGMHNGFQGAKSDYWDGVDKQIQSHFNDSNVLYYDGSFGGAFNLVFARFGQYHNYDASNRILMGKELGYEECETVLTKLDPDETVKIVSHSMGSATAKGFIKGMKEYAGEDKVTSLIDFELDLAPFQPKEQQDQLHGKTIVIQHQNDGIAGAEPMKGAINKVTHKGKSNNPANKIKEHKVSSFKDDIYGVLNKLLEHITTFENK